MKYSRSQMYLPVLSIAAGLFVYGVVMGAPHAAFIQTTHLVASVSVGAFASVDPNQFNTLAQQLGEKEKELLARENELNTRAESQQREANTVSMISILSFVLSLVLMVFLGINFYLDARRGRALRRADGVPVINLRSRG